MRVALSCLVAAQFALGVSVHGQQPPLKLPAIISDHMVLPAGRAVPLWGWAQPGEEVRVSASFGAKASARAGTDGRFELILETPKAEAVTAHGAAAHALTFSCGDHEVVVRDVLVGDVWLASGQSNMEMAVGPSRTGRKGVDDWEKEINDAPPPSMRLFTVKNVTSWAPLQDAGGSWVPCTPETVKDFSATAYFFGRALARRLNVPVGLVASDWGGTICESWTSREAVSKLDGFEDDLALAARLTSAADGAGPKDPPFHANRATALYNGMIAPLGPFAFRGVIWYQGESNVGRADTYARHFAAMIADWRRQFRTPELPFYFVQIAPFAYSNDTGNAAELRFQQLLTHRQVPNTGIAITMDIGDPGDIHPRNKQDVGMRLALWALRFAYGKDDVNASGPLFRDVDVESGRLRVHFDHAEGLATTDGKAPSLFEIRGAEGAWVPARAEIQGETILLSSPDVAAPRMARFARGAADRPNLTNAAGLPASTFRTGGSMDSGG